jgi:hypothetical protein
MFHKATLSFKILELSVELIDTGYFIFPETYKRDENEEILIWIINV